MSKLKLYSNGGSEDGFSMQCMLISILDYLRKKTKILEGYSLRRFREENNITPKRWGSHMDFQNDNKEQIKILQELSKKYELNIYLQHLDGMKVSEPKIVQGLNYIVGYTDIYIMQKPGHYELIDSDIITTIEDFIYIPIIIDPKKSISELKTKMKELMKELIISTGEIKFFRSQLYNIYKEYYEFLLNPDMDLPQFIIESTIDNFNFYIQKLENRIKICNSESYFIYNCKKSYYDYSQKNQIKIKEAYKKFLELELDRYTIIVIEVGTVKGKEKKHTITFIKNIKQSDKKSSKCLLLKY